jgi:hypothetical protein
VCHAVIRRVRLLTIQLARLTLWPIVDSDRSARIKRQKGQGIVRALHESELSNAGAEREHALRHAEYQLERIARLLPDAIDAGLGMTEIARLTGLSRPTLYELRGRYSESPRDLQLAVMQALMRRETSFPDALPAHLGRPVDEVRPVLTEFFKRGWIEWDVDGGEPRPQPEEGGLIFAVGPEDLAYPYMITLAGYEALEQWKFEDDEGDDEGAATS